MADYPGVRGIGKVDGLEDALTAKAELQGFDLGGQILRAPRVPTAAVRSMLPALGASHRPVWVGDGGATVKAIGVDNQIRRTLDGARTWGLFTPLGSAITSEVGARGCWLELMNGDVLTLANTAPHQIRRNTTDGGATWGSATVNAAGPTSLRANVSPLGSQSWCQDKVTGHVYLGEYTIDSSFTEIRLLRSTDNGATWHTFHTFPGPATSDPLKVRHIHAVQYDDVSQRVYITCGDSSDGGSGIYRVNADSTSIETVFLSSWVGAPMYPVALCFFPDYLVWGGDSYETPNVIRLARSDIGNPAASAEVGYRLSSVSYGTVRLAADKWVILTVNDGVNVRLDRALHLYLVTQNGSVVNELGSIAAPHGLLPAPFPVGQAELHTEDSFWFTARAFPHTVAYDVALSRGVAGLPHAPQKQAHYGLHTIACPITEVAAGGSHVFGLVKAPKTTPRLLIHDIGIKKTAGSGTLKVSVFRTSNSTELTSATNFLRADSFRESSDFLSSHLLSQWNEVELRLVETGGASPATGIAYVTFAWGE